MAEPPEKQLSILSFVVHATRGVIRDQNIRRKTMFVVLVVALVLLFSGSTFLQSNLNPHEHPVWVIFYWLICVWLTLTAMLLALFDMRVVRARTRNAGKVLRNRLSETENPDSSDNE